MNEPMRVAVNGCFDLLHVGHLRLLQFASRYGRVYVGVNSDESVRKLKGDCRPVIPESERVAMLSALRCVYSAQIFNGTTATEFLAQIKPHYWVKGSEYQLHPELLNKEELAAVLACGGKVVYAPRAESSQSTSRIINGIYGNLSRCHGGEILSQPGSSITIRSVPLPNAVKSAIDKSLSGA